MSVPRIIHQIMFNFDTNYPPTDKSYINKPIPEKWKKSNSEWKKIHPTWKYILWNDLMVYNMIKDYYPFFLETYLNYKYPIQRVDAAKYFILHRYGGIYVDLDLYPNEPIDKYFTSTGIDAYFSYGKSCVGNSFMASKKNSIFWTFLFDELMKVKLNMFIKFSKHFTVMSTTGPIFLNNVISKYDNGIIGRLPKKFFSHELYCGETSVLSSLEGMSWCGWDSYIFNFLYKNLVFNIFLLVLSVILIIFILGFFVIEFRQKYNICKNS